MAYSLDSFAEFVGTLTIDGGRRMELLPYQRTLLDDYFSGARETVIICPKKNGKALALDTPIPTPSGWTTMGELCVGDEIFDDKGEPTRVRFVTEEMVGHDCYRVGFSDGTSIVADADHLWLTSTLKPEATTRTWTTSQIAATLERGDGARNHSVSVAGALQTKPLDLPVHPYVLGAWLGDGESKSGRITVGEPFVLEEISSLGYEVSHNHSKASRAAMHTVYGLVRGLRILGVYANKHIPAVYLRASEAQRMDLLQGLMDTDGSISLRGQCCFDTIKPVLRDGVLELVRSLGFKPTWGRHRATINGKDCGWSYRIQFHAFSDRPVFRMPRKRARQKMAPPRKARSTTRQIVSVGPVPSVPVRCITVDSPSHLYLAGEGMIPTHNTTLLAALALYHLREVEGAEVVIAAASRDQARILFKQAAMIIQRSKLTETFTPKPGYGEVRLKKDGIHTIGARIRVLAADSNTADGVIPTLALVDELHRHQSADLYGVFRDGLGPRDGQMLTISTAGGTVESPLGDLRTRARLLPSYRRDGCYSYAASSDGAFVLHEWSLQPEEDRMDLQLVKQANPAPWHTIGALRERLESPSTTPSQWARFACGVWTDAEDPWVNAEEWDACGGPLPDLAGRVCYGGLDLSATTDTTAFMLVFPLDDGRVAVETHVFLPEDGLVKRIQRDRAPYSEWSDSGFLVLTPGNVVDYAFVKHAIVAAAKRYKLRELGYDRWNSSQLVTELQEAGLRLAPVGQGFKDAAQPMLELRRLVLERRLVHGAHPVLRRHMLSTAVQTDPAGNTKPRKDKSAGRIDAVAALVTALGIAARHTKKSAYASRMCSCGKGRAHFVENCPDRVVA